MDSPFMFDLATLRNPRTSFSYVNYLLARKRLIEFANSDRLNPLREEFDDYMKWCAEQFKDQVRYDSEVIDVAREEEGEVVRRWKITVRDGTGQTYTVRARTLIAPSPKKQDTTIIEPLSSVDFLAGQRIMSMAEYVVRRNELRGTREPRLNVSIIGSDRRTTEILDDLLTCPRLGNITVVTDDESLAPLVVLQEESEPAQLCSIWSKSPTKSKHSITEASEVVQNIYMRAYEKRIQSQGQYTLRIVFGKNTTAACSGSDIIIRDTATRPWSGNKLLQSIDTLALGCRRLGESVEEVQFKRGAVMDSCRLWLMSSKSEGGRALPKDVALSAGDVVRQVCSTAENQRDGGAPVQARI